MASDCSTTNTPGIHPFKKPEFAEDVMWRCHAKSCKVDKYPPEQHPYGKCDKETMKDWKIEIEHGEYGLMGEYMFAEMS